MLLFTNIAAAQLSLPEKVKIFSKVWNTINQKYYDPNFNGINWAATREFYLQRVEMTKDDKEFYVLVKQMVGELDDAHTGFR
jgi:carboxyl-terminal processing protease